MTVLTQNKNINLKFNVYIFIIVVNSEQNNVYLRHCALLVTATGFLNRACLAWN